MANIRSLADHHNDTAVVYIERYRGILFPYTRKNQQIFYVERSRVFLKKRV